MQCRDTGEDFLQRRFAETCQAFCLGGAAYFGARPALYDHFTNVVGQIQQLMNGGSAPVARMITRITPNIQEKRGVAVLFGSQSRFKQFVLAGTVLTFA